MSTRAVMHYQNESGEVSIRTVDVIQWSHARNGHTYLRAWCHLRGEERTFRADRIVLWLEESRGEPAAPPAARPVPPPAAQPAAATPRPKPATTAGDILGRLVAGVAAALLVGALGNSLFTSTSPAATYSSTVQALARGAVVHIAAAPTAAAPVRPAPAPDTPRQARGRRFYRFTSIASARLLDFYESADWDRSGSLSMAEIKGFQARLYMRYRYRENERALRPDQFLEAGGGDCEDWALMAAGLLRYWGLTPWIASYGGGEVTAHAVCYLQLPGAVAGYGSIEVAEAVELPGARLPAGYYVPIDYDNVGTLSNAVKPGWSVQDAWVPERLYGVVM